MPRFRVRTLMIAVAAVALVLGSIKPTRKAYRLLSYRRSQAEWCRRAQRLDLLRADREQQRATELAAYKATWTRSPDFAARIQPGQEKIIDAAIEFHQTQSQQARVSARRWADRRREELTLAWFCWDPDAPDAP
jgi:hypothetical protein